MGGVIGAFHRLRRSLEEGDRALVLGQVGHVILHVGSGFFHPGGLGVDDHHRAGDGQRRILVFGHGQIQRLEVFIQILHLAQRQHRGIVLEKDLFIIHGFVFIVELPQLLEVDVLKGLQKRFKLRGIEDQLSFLFLDVGHILAQNAGKEAVLIEPVKQIILGIIVRVIIDPVGGELHQIQQGLGQIVLRQAQRFPRIHIDAVGIGVGVHRQAVEPSVLHQDLAELGIHAFGRLHQRLVVRQVGAVALLQKPVHRHVVQAQEQHVIGVGIADHGLGQGFQITGIIPRRLHGNFRVRLHELLMRLRTRFAEDAQRALFQRRAVEQVGAQPGIAVRDIVAVLAQRRRSAAPIHSRAGVGSDLDLPVLRIDAHDPGAVLIINLVPVAAEAPQIINAHLIIAGDRPFRAQRAALRVEDCQRGGQLIHRGFAGVQGAPIAQEQRQLPILIDAGVGYIFHLEHLAGFARQRNAAKAGIARAAGVGVAHKVQPVPHHKAGVGAHGIGIIPVLFHHHVQIQPDGLFLHFQLALLVQQGIPLLRVGIEQVKLIPPDDQKAAGNMIAAAVVAHELFGRDRPQPHGSPAGHGLFKQHTVLCLGKEIVMILQAGDSAVKIARAGIVRSFLIGGIGGYCFGHSRRNAPDRQQDQHRQQGAQHGKAFSLHRFLPFPAAAPPGGSVYQLYHTTSYSGFEGVYLLQNCPSCKN